MLVVVVGILIQTISVCCSDNLFGNYELVPTDPPESLEATPKCGENDQLNEYICVPFYNCNFNTDTVFENPDVDGSNVISKEPRAHQQMDPTCDDFIHVCCHVANVSTASNSNLTEINMTYEEQKVWQNCGRFNPEKNTQPWLISIVANDNGTKDTKMCEGSLIAPRVVLTAAHCLQGKTEQDLKVKSTEINPQEILVDALLIHEHFMPSTRYNDVALIILKESFRKTENISTVCLLQANSNKYNQTLCKNSNLDSVQTMTRRDCQNQLRSTDLGKYFRLERTFLCSTHGKDTQLLGGEPLICQNEFNTNVYFQVGLFSWSLPKDPHGPEVYNDVGNMRYWIDYKVSLMGLSKITYSWN